MRTALEEMDVNAVTRLNRDFHFTLYASCPNHTLVELITHLAFYAGWPTAASAVTIARRAFEEYGAP